MARSDPRDEPPNEPMDGLLRKASPAGDLMARQALHELQARLFGRPPSVVRLGRYVLEERIGAGGSGMVYRAFDPKHDRKVALKLLRVGEGRGYEAARARLLREAQALGKLHHPNVVRIFDVGTYDPAVLDPQARGRHDEGVYLAMEFLDGSNLAAWLAEEPRSWQTVREAFVAAAHGLAAAHAQGIIHRDFKPANVSIDGEGHVRVLDFGLARPLAMELDDASARMTEGAQQRLDALARPLDATLTAPGTLLGTPAYMAPEQHDRQRATARSDQYALCLALYEAWYEQRPFLASSEPELRQLKRRGELLPPPAGSEVPPHLFAVLQRGLAPRPEDRFESMEALVQALVGEAPRRPGPRWAWWAAASLAGALAVGAGAWALAGSGGRSQPEPSPAVACAERQRERLAGLVEGAREADDLTRQRVAEALARWPAASRCDDAIGEALLQHAAGRTPEALARARQAHADAAAHGEPTHLVAAAALRGHLALVLGEAAEAEAALTEALWGHDDAAHADSLRATIDLLALARRTSPRPADAPLWIRLARERAALPTVAPALRLRLYLGLGQLALDDGDLSRARVDLEQALALPVDEGSAPWRSQAEQTLATIMRP